MVKVQEIMKKRVITTDPNKTITDAARIMTNNKVGSLIVTENGDEISDIVTLSDVTTIVAKNLDPNKMKISDLRKRGLKRRDKLITVKPDDNILEVAKLMVKNGVKRVPVLEKGKLKGILADKEILIVSPELIEIMSEKMKNRVEMVTGSEEIIPGICESCGVYSDELKHLHDRWLCQDCREE